MASIRRTLSPVPRAGAIRNGENNHLVPSPLSKGSYTQSHFQSGGISLDPYLIFYKIQSVLLGIFSRRSSRPLDRSKSKGPFWRRAFFHLLACFLLGILVGLTPLSENLSINFVSKNQAFSFEDTPLAINAQQHDDKSINISSEFDTSVSQNEMSLEIDEKKQELIANDVPVPRLPSQGLMSPSRKLLIVVTPTYGRPFQTYYLLRLAYTLRLVPPPLLWIVVEMSSQSTETADILRRTGVMYRHLVCDKNLTIIRDRNVHQRNVALSHIETHRLDGIVYFADDNNMYSVELFEHMREIRRFGTWPIAVLTENKVKTVLEGPVCNGSQVNGWHTNDRRIRRFYAHMSGFAFNSTVLWDPKRWHLPTLEPIRHLDKLKDGLQASRFVEQLIEDESQMEGFGNCSKMMVWNLQLEASQPFYPRRWLMKKNLDVVAPLFQNS
ncbi:hypothetical protein ACHQM5_002129 [Ranunculus cassubicifolius]